MFLFITTIIFYVFFYVSCVSSTVSAVSGVLFSAFGSSVAGVVLPSSVFSSSEAGAREAAIILSSSDTRTRRIPLAARPCFEIWSDDIRII